MEAQALAQVHKELYSLYNGDSCQVIKAIPDNSIDMIVFSPPFSNLYIYTDIPEDMGNAKDDDEFFAHFGFLIPELHRITVPGRICAVHCKDLPLYFGRDEASGLKDFPGRLIVEMEKGGWTFHSRVTIWKCPVTERERTNNNGLLHKTVCRDRSQLRQGMADYMLMFRKVEGELMSAKPVGTARGFEKYIGDKALDPRTSNEHPSKFARKGSTSDPSINIWRRYAEPVWWDIDQTDVLNFKLGRDSKDERHICPLQLGVIRRAIEIWSNPGDTIFSPFGGIGSEPYTAITEGRKAVAIELKDSYFKEMVKNCERAVEVAKTSQKTLFSGNDK